MIKKLKEMNELKRMYVLLGIISFIGLIIMVILSLTCVSWGWTSGFVFGSLITSLSIYLIYKSSEWMSKQSEKKSALVLAYLFVIIRFAIYIGGLVLSALFEFKWGLGRYLAVFGTFIAYLPLQIVVLINYGLRKSE